MADFTIRSCRPDEYMTVLALWDAADSIPSRTASTEALTAYLEKDGDLLLVAEVDNRIVGTVMGGWDGWRGNIYRLAVLPEYRRRGIGRALVKEVERLLVQRGARKISLLVGKEEETTLKFWESLKRYGYELDNRVIRFTKMVQP